MQYLLLFDNIIICSTSIFIHMSNANKQFQGLAHSFTGSPDAPTVYF